MKSKEKIIIQHIEMGKSGDVWYTCSDGNTYYDSIYYYDLEAGDELDVDNMNICSLTF